MQLENLDYLAVSDDEEEQNREFILVL